MGRCFQEPIPHPVKLDIGGEATTNYKVNNNYDILDNFREGEHDESIDETSSITSDNSSIGGPDDSREDTEDCLNCDDNFNARAGTGDRPCLRTGCPRSRKNTSIMNMFQLDGNVSTEESDEDSVSNYSTDEEVDSEPVRAVLIPASRLDGQPFTLTVDETEQVAPPTSLPLTMVANFRSIYNKAKNGLMPNPPVTILPLN